MEPTYAIALLFVAAALGMPIAFALILSCLLMFLHIGSIRFMAIPQNMVGGVDSFILLAVPMFILAAKVMNSAQITDRIKDAAGVMMGKDYLAGLPADVQAAVKDAAAVAGKFIGDFNQKQENQYIQNFKDAGVTVIEPDQAAFRKKFEGFIEKYDPKLGEFAAKVKASM